MSSLMRSIQNKKHLSLMHDSIGLHVALFAEK